MAGTAPWPLSLRDDFVCVAKEYGVLRREKHELVKYGNVCVVEHVQQRRHQDTVYARV